MQQKKLPIGIQTFRDIRDLKENYVYVDKTEMAYRLISEGKYYFLSRPRRFGKSLFLDTLSEVFLGHKQHFKGLYIEDKWDWAQSFPVIRIDFTIGGFRSEESINEVIKENLSYNCETHQIDGTNLESSLPSIYFQKVIREVHQKYNQKVVILIDEYDKPILDNIGQVDKSVSLIARDILRNFYSAIKASDTYIRLVFITGVSKFSKLNLFSGLNNIKDITVDPKYAIITGYTQSDLEREFKGYLKGIDLDTVKKWYNGYNYFGDPVYNPFDILLFFSRDGEFSNYWWETGNPAFLIEKLKEGNYFLPDLENISVSKETLSAFDIEYIDIVALLWQTGYLTFDKKIGDESDSFYKMKVPNLEVQKSLNNLFFDYLCNLQHKKGRIFLSLKDALKANNIEGFVEQLKVLFSSIPYTNYVNNTIADFEGYYASVIFAFLCTLGYDVIAEDTTNLGRVDMTIISPATIFILEFKVDMPKEAALQQINTRKYYEKYLNEEKEIYLVGIHFDSKEKNIKEYEYKVLN